MTATEHVLRRSSIVMVLGGVLLISTYFLLSAFKVGEIGAPTDIGGG